MTQHEFMKKLDGYFIAFCRRADRWSPMYKGALKNAFVRRKNKIEYYKCNQCQKVISRKNKHVDHIEPVFPFGHKWRKTGLLNWNYYREGLFVESYKRQVLCKVCHKVKTTKENKLRKAMKR